jgi:2-keto-4-pentenoate hydratase
MQDTELRATAAALRTARADRTPISAPSKTWPALDADAGFKVQQLNVEAAVAAGDRLVGYKLGNIAKVMQAAFGLDQPDYGYLLASSFAYEGTTLARDQYIEPFVELEPAFILRSRLGGPNTTVADVINAVEYALPAIEIIDSRVQDWAISLPDTLADNGSTGSVILGGTEPSRHHWRPKVQRPRRHHRQHRQHPGQPTGCRRLAVQPARRLRHRVLPRPGHPARQLPQGRPDEGGRAMVRHLPGLGNHRIRRHLTGEEMTRQSYRQKFLRPSHLN